MTLIATGLLTTAGGDTAAFANGADAAPSIVIKPGEKLAFLGASITAFGWIHPKGYLHLVVDCLAKNDNAIVPIVAGVSGNTSRDMLARIAPDVIDKKPDWVTVDAGGNDVWHGNIGFEEYMTNMTGIVDKAQKAGIKVILQTCTPILEDLNADTNQRLDYYNKFQRYLTAQKGCLLAEIYAPAVDAIKAKTSPDNLLTLDGVHMNDRGDRLMARGLLRTLGLTDAQIATTIPAD